MKQLPVDVSQRYGAQTFGALPSFGADWVPSLLQVAVTEETLHTFAVQVNPAAQSAADAQADLHAAAPQT